MPTAIPYGAWPSPITAADVARGSRGVGAGSYAGNEIWWAEQLPEQGGRTSVRRFGAGGGVEDLLPAPWNARSRVHEYGGGEWCTVGDGEDQSLVFVELTDQRLHRIRPGQSEPVPLTPTPATPAGVRYGGLCALPGSSDVLAVRETHRAGGITRDIVAVPLDGSGATDDARIRSVAGGTDFLAMPAPSPDGRRVSWIAWDHPQMPWDGTWLRMATQRDDGTWSEPVTLLGSPTESVLQPGWLDDGALVVLTDRSGWWNLHHVAADADVEAGGDAEPLGPMAAEVGGPLWQLGMRWYTQLDDGRIAFVRNEKGVHSLWLLDPAGRTTQPVELRGVTALTVGGHSGSRLLVTAGGPGMAAGLREVDVDGGTVRDVRLAVDALPAAGWLPAARVRTFTGSSGREVHAVVYPPASPDAEAPAGELPPYIVHVHGGPTSQTYPAFQLAIAYWTSRGIGILDVNYGGSTGYGRDYRDRLRGQWGVVDVEDVVAAATGLAAAGEADASRLAIEGGSAGGWTVLAALTSTDAFACGVSSYGVADLMRLVESTHDFESRYLDGLVGRLPEDEQLYVERAPVNHVDDLSVPVLLLQGLDDPVVPPSQAEAFRDALARKGVPHAYLAFEGESHGFRLPETKIRCLEASLSFYGQVLGFDPPGIPRLPLT